MVPAVVAREEGDVEVGDAHFAGFGRMELDGRPCSLERSEV